MSLEEVAKNSKFFLLAMYSWSRKSDLNWWPAAYKAAALPTELLRRNACILDDFALFRNFFASLRGCFGWF